MGVQNCGCALSNWNGSTQQTPLGEVNLNINQYSYSPPKPGFSPTRTQARQQQLHSYRHTTSDRSGQVYSNMVENNGNFGSNRQAVGPLSNSPHKMSKTVNYQTSMNIGSGGSSGFKNKSGGSGVGNDPVPLGLHLIQNNHKPLSNSPGFINRMSPNQKATLPKQQQNLSLNYINNQPIYR